MLFESFAEFVFAFARLLQQPPVDDIANVGGCQMDAKLRRKAVLCPDEECIAGLFVDLLLAKSKQPCLSLQLATQFRSHCPQPVHPLLIGKHVLRNFVDDKEQRPVRLAETHHFADGVDGFRRRIGNRCSSSAVDPAHGIDVTVPVEVVQDFRKGLVSKRLVLFILPRMTDLVRNFEKLLPLAGLFQPQLEVSDERVLLAVTESLLNLSHAGRMNVLVVAGEAADIEYDGKWFGDLLTKGLPRLTEFLGTVRHVTAEQGLGQRFAVGQFHTVQCQPQQLRETRFTGTVEAGDPRRGKRRPTVLVHFFADCGQQPNILLVNAIRHTFVVRMILVPAARDDVLGNFVLYLVRALFVEIDDRRNITSDILAK